MIQFNHIDTKRPDGVYVAFEHVVTPDYVASAADYDDGVFPEDQEFIGIQARADILIVRSGVGTFYQLTSPGVWAVEANAVDEPYGLEIYDQECAILKADIAALAGPVTYAEI